MANSRTTGVITSFKNFQMCDVIMHGYLDHFIVHFAIPDSRTSAHALICKLQQVDTINNDIDISISTPESKCASTQEVDQEVGKASTTSVVHDSKVRRSSRLQDMYKGFFFKAHVLIKYGLQC
jgi:hypothetical protein